MSHTLAIPHYRRVGRKAGGRRSLLLGALLGLAVGGLAFAIAQVAVPQVRAALDLLSTTASVSQLEFPARELPREWRWEPPGVEVEHMYRRVEVPRLDWIREGRGH